MEREDTPGPQAYDVTLNERLEGAALEEMRSSLETLASCEGGGLETLETDEWPFVTERSRAGGGGDYGCLMELSDEPRGRPDDGGEGELEEAATASPTVAATDRLRRPRLGKCASCCHPLSSIQGNIRRVPENVARQKQQRYSPCRHCLHAEASGAASTFLAAASSLSDPNSRRRAKTTGATVTFGDMPRLRSAPAFSIGMGDRETYARRLHTPGNIIYKEARLGRSAAYAVYVWLGSCLYSC